MVQGRRAGQPDPLFAPDNETSSNSKPPHDLTPCYQTGSAIRVRNHLWITFDGQSQEVVASSRINA